MMALEINTTSQTISDIQKSSSHLFFTFSFETIMAPFLKTFDNIGTNYTNIVGSI